MAFVYTVKMLCKTREATTLVATNRCTARLQHNRQEVTPERTHTHKLTHTHSTWKLLGIVTNRLIMRDK